MGVKGFITKQWNSLTGSLGGSGIMGMTLNSVNWFGDNQSTLLKNGYMQNVHVYTAVNVYLNKAKVAPFLLSKVKNDKAVIKYEQFIKSKDDSHRLTAMMLKEQALEELESHELLNLLNNPNTYQTASEFRESALGFYKLLGETFIYGIGPIEGSNKGKFKELHVINPTMIEPVYSNNALDPISHYKLSLDGTQVRIEKENILHFKAWNPALDNNLRGFSPLYVANKTLTRNAANETAQTKAFQNGGVAHLLSSDSADRPLTQEQLDLINERLIKTIKGAENYQSITATNGLVRATKIGESPADMQLIESDRHDRGIIASLFGIDPILVGDKNGSSYSNQEQAYKGLVTNLIMPDLITFGENLSNWLLPRYKGEKLHLTFDTTVYPELSPDLLEMSKYLGSPMLSPNEVRSAFNWDAVNTPEMNDYYIKSGLIPLSRIGEVDLNRQGNNPNQQVQEDK